MHKRYVIAHDGTLDGDCGLDPMMVIDASEVKDNLLVNNIDLVKQLVHEYVLREYYDNQDDEEITDEINEDYCDEVKGYWIIDEKTMELMEILADTDCGGDSAVYELQRILKKVANHMGVSYGVKPE